MFVCGWPPLFVVNIIRQSFPNLNVTYLCVGGPTVCCKDHKTKFYKFKCYMFVCGWPPIVCSKYHKTKFSKFKCYMFVCGCPPLFVVNVIRQSFPNLNVTCLCVGGPH